MTLLSGKEAAKLAEGVYNIYSARDGGDAATIAERNIEQGIGVGEVEAVAPRAGLMGESGAFVKERTGFGLVLDRGLASNRELIVVTRGTIFTSGSDWLSNINIGFDKGPDGSLVHAGFNRVYRSYADELREVIRRARPQKIHFVGHSLGGALATLGASEFAVRHRLPCYLYTFGAPRVGSLGLTSNLRSFLPETNIRRVYSLSDPVPMIPLLPFTHLGLGSTGINAGFNSITSSAHSMAGCYVPNMPQSGWPPQIALPNRSDPEYWLDMAARSTGLFSSMGYYFLGKALETIMGALNVIGIGLGVGVTVLDRLATAVQNSAILASRVGQSVFRWVKIALRLVGRAAMAGMIAAGDLTSRFLQFVFGLLMNPVLTAARAAVGRL